MAKLKKKINSQRSWPWWKLIIAGLSIFALILSITLSWHYLSGKSMIGCGGGSSCDQVLGSRWSMLFGQIPVSGLASGAYLALLVAILFIGPSAEVSIRRLAWGTMLILVGSIAGSAIWFTIVQKWIIGQFCFYCMTTHTTGLLVAGLVIWRSNKEVNNNKLDIKQAKDRKNQKLKQPGKQHILSLSASMGLVFTGLALAAVLAVSQLAFTPRNVYSDGESQNNMTSIDYQNAPMIGSPEAPNVITLLFDYQCPHCQKIHFMLNEVVRRYNGKLAFALCPTPLDSNCNPYIPETSDAFKNSCELAKIGLAVWLANPEAFSDFENWMFTYETGNNWQPRGVQAAREKAIDLVGQAKFDAAWLNPWIEQYVQTSIRIFGQTILTGNGAIPKMIFGSKWLIPEPYNTEDLISILQNSLGVPAP